MADCASHGFESSDWQRQTMVELPQQAMWGEFQSSAFSTMLTFLANQLILGVSG